MLTKTKLIFRTLKRDDVKLDRRHNSLNPVLRSKQRQVGLFKFRASLLYATAMNSRLAKSAQ